MDDQVPVREDPSGDGGLKRIVAELRQWHVFRVAATYAVASWLVIQVIATVGPAFDAPAWLLRGAVLSAVLGFFATMGVLLFRPKARGRGKLPVYLSAPARMTAGAGVLLAVAVAVLVSIRALGEPAPISLAVLPFADLSPQHDKGYFAEGVAEEILSSLAAEKGIKVLGSTSARQIERNPDPHEIRATLGVTHLLEGSTRTAGNDLRVNVRLIDTSDGSQLWEQEYRGGVSDVFKVQDQIATSVLSHLRGTLFAKQVHVASPTPIDAYEAYLAARALIRQNKPQPMMRAWAMARQIIDQHPDYAPGQALYAQLADLLTDGPYSYGNIPPAKSRPIILAHASLAIRLAPNQADGYAAISPVLPVQDRVRSYQKALMLDPSRADVRLRLGIALNLLRRNDEASEQYRLAYETDPLSAAVVNRYTQSLAASGQVNEAMRVIDQFETRGGSKAQAWRFRGNTYRLIADEARHIAARRRALALDPDLPYQHEWLAQSLALLGLGDQSAADVARLSPYDRMFFTDDRGALRQSVATDGPAAWDKNGLARAIFSLARSRDWPAIVRFYDVRPADYRDICPLVLPFSPFVILALRNAGRAAEAQRLLQCTQTQLRNEMSQRSRGSDDAPGELEVIQASLLAMQNDHRALDALDSAVKRGWLGQYYSSRLADWPQFDALAADPRYAALQQRIDATIARQRAGVLASSGH